jgi:AraC-like DNA-binding protein
VPWSTIARFTDPSACERAIQGVSAIEIYPMSSGKFDTEITKVRFNRVWMQRFHSSLPQIVTYGPSSDRQAISFLTEEKSPQLLYCGVEVLPGNIVVSGSDVVHKRFDADIRKGAMSLPKAELNSAFEALMGFGIREQQDLRIVRPDPAVMSRLLQLHRGIGQLAHDTPDVLELPEIDRALEQQLIHLMVRCLAGNDTVRISPGRRRHAATMVKLEEFLEANSDRPLYLPEVCAALNVAERSLRASCEEHLGMGPIRYLTLRRMRLVRKALLLAEHSETTVTSVATDHGFWELGRFSVAYRALFGEAPSDTLRRPAIQAVVEVTRPSSLPMARPGGWAN